MYLIDGYTNIIYDDNSCPDLDFLDVREFIVDIMHQVISRLGNDFDNFCFVVFSTNSDGRIPATLLKEYPGQKKVLLYLLDEAGTAVNELADNYDYVFKQYLPFETTNNIYPFPVGHVNKVRFNKDEISPVNDRPLNVFFSGSLNKNRTDFFNQFSIIKAPSTNFIKKIIRIPFIKRKAKVIKDFFIRYQKKELLSDSYINITNGFKQGLSRDNYVQYLLRSKIALCPSGASCTETYRHYEAMAAGCVIISDKLPQISLYENSPIIQVENWNEGIEIAQKLLKSPRELEELQKASIQFWNCHYSPDAVAENIIKKIY